MAKIYNSAQELIGSTPLVRLDNIKRELNLKADILAKLEFLNPAGSAKDRVALRIIEDAEKSGRINKDSVIIEPTSGNTGIGLAAVCAVRGYRTIIVMPDTMSVERRQLMTAYGAELVLSKGSEGMTGAIREAKRLSEEIPGSFIAGQFVNPSNALAHKETTGPEIWSDTDGKVDFLVAGIGTGGTITGTGEYLKEMNPRVKVIGVEPSDSPFLSRGKAGAHKLQGIGAGFVPEILNTKIYDEIITVTSEDAFSFGRMSALKEGLLVGISSGAALKAAIEIASREENEGKTIVVILPDTGSRYLSTEMFSE